MVARESLEQIGSPMTKSTIIVNLVFSHVSCHFAEGTMMGDVTVPTLSMTLLSTTLKRGPGGDAVEYGTVDLATQLIKVQILFWFISKDSFAIPQ